MSDISRALPETHPVPSLRHLPIGVFGMSMGLFGAALALRAAGLGAASDAAGIVAALVFALLLAAFALKALRHPGALAADWAHPVRLAFFPAISISLLLLATLLEPHARQTAWAVWALGTAAQGALTLVVISAWIGHRAFVPMHVSPAWFIPAVGNVIVPLAGVPLGHPEIAWFFLSVGLIFWIVLLTVVFNRLIFHDPLPERLRPTLVILVAPPAVGFLAWVQLHGGIVDDMARILLNAGYFFAALVVLQARALLQLPFMLSFWALSFPLAALTTASFRFAALMESPVHHALGIGLLVLLGAVVAALASRTLRAAMAGQICVPE